MTVLTLDLQWSDRISDDSGKDYWTLNYHTNFKMSAVQMSIAEIDNYLMVDYL